MGFLRYFNLYAASRDDNITIFKDAQHYIILSTTVNRTFVYARRAQANADPDPCNSNNSRLKHGQVGAAAV